MCGVDDSSIRAFALIALISLCLAALVIISYCCANCFKSKGQRQNRPDEQQADDLENGQAAAGARTTSVVNGIVVADTAAQNDE